MVNSSILLFFNIFNFRVAQNVALNVAQKGRIGT